VVSLVIEAKSSVTPERRGQNPHLTPQETVFFPESRRFSHFSGRNSLDVTPQLSPRFSQSHAAAGSCGMAAWQMTPLVLTTDRRVVAAVRMQDGSPAHSPARARRAAARPRALPLLPAAAAAVEAGEATGRSRSSTPRRTWPRCVAGWLLSWLWVVVGTCLVGCGWLVVVGCG
jgi:hypothetical protein